MDEDKQHKAIQRGRKAQGLLDSEALRDAAEVMRRDIFDEWASPKSTPEERERLWLAYQLLPRFENALVKTAGNGRVAQMDLDRLAGRK